MKTGITEITEITRITNITNITNTGLLPVPVFSFPVPDMNVRDKRTE